VSVERKKVYKLPPGMTTELGGKSWRLRSDCSIM
jgi:hypothetical protein